jgi:hypothetical protein
MTQENDYGVDLSIVIAKPEWSKIEAYTDLCPDEIACMGYARIDGNNVVVDTVFLVPQVVSLGSVEFIETGLPFAVQKAIEDDRLDDLRFCWHSHSTHAAFFSDTDKDMVRKVRDSGPIPWFASAVLNKAGNTHGQIDYFDIGGALGKFAKHVTVELDVCVEGRIVDNELERIEEIEEYVTHKREYEKTKKASASTNSHGAAREQIDFQKKWEPKPTARDMKLHKKARENRWDSYIADDCAYYWSEGGNFEGSAPIPIDDNGVYEIDIEQSVYDAELDEDATAAIALDDVEQALLTMGEQAGQI